MPNNFYFVYITASSKAEASKIGKELVQSKLAACANIIDKMSSIYWWQGQITEADEAVLILKTQQKFLNEITKKVKELHSYSVPCVIAMPIEDGNPEYLNWIASELS